MGGGVFLGISFFGRFGDLATMTGTAKMFCWHCILDCTWPVPLKQEVGALALVWSWALRLRFLWGRSFVVSYIFAGLGGGSLPPRQGIYFLVLLIDFGGNFH